VPITTAIVNSELLLVVVNEICNVCLKTHWQVAVTGGLPMIIEAGFYQAESLLAHCEL
jgi:hypothetical protein